MTPEEIQNTMDFILRSQADSVIRMERLDEKFQAQNEKRQEQIDLLAAAAHDLVKVGRRHEESLRRMDKSISILTRIANGHSKLIARLEGKGR